MRRVAVQRILPPLRDIGLGDGEDRGDHEGRGGLVEEAIARGGRHRAAELIGLVGDDRRYVAALDHVEADRLR